MASSVPPSTSSATATSTNTRGIEKGKDQTGECTRPAQPSPTSPTRTDDGTSSPPAFFPKDFAYAPQENRLLGGGSNYAAWRESTVEQLRLYGVWTLVAGEEDEMERGKEGERRGDGKGKQGKNGGGGTPLHKKRWFIYRETVARRLLMSSLTGDFRRSVALYMSCRNSSDPKVLWAALNKRYGWCQPSQG